MKAVRKPFAILLAVMLLVTMIPMGAAAADATGAAPGQEPNQTVQDGNTQKTDENGNSQSPAQNNSGQSAVKTDDSGKNETSGNPAGGSGGESAGTVGTNDQNGAGSESGTNGSAGVTGDPAQAGGANGTTETTGTGTPGENGTSSETTGTNISGETGTPAGTNETNETTGTNTSGGTDASGGTNEINGTGETTGSNTSGETGGTNETTEPGTPGGASQSGETTGTPEGTETTESTEPGGLLTAPAGEEEVETPPLKAAVTGNNMTVDLTVSGPLNGPYTLTLTAQQDSDSAEAFQWTASSEMVFQMNNSLFIIPDDADINTSDTGVNVTNDGGRKLTITGYDYSAHAGEALEVTVSGLKIDSESAAYADLATGQSDQNVSWYNQGSYVSAGDGMHVVYFPQATVPVLKLAAPRPKWEGRIVTWDPVEGAETYEYTCYGDEVETSGTVSGSETAPSVDLSDFVNTNGAANYHFRVKAKAGTAENSHYEVVMNQALQEFCTVKITPVAKKASSSYGELGTEGGTVSATAASGDSFSGPDEDGIIEGLFAAGDDTKTGDTITVTATAKDGYEFSTFRDYMGETGLEDPTDNPFVFEVKRDQNISAWFEEIEQPAPVLKIILECGTGHEQAAAKVLAAAQDQGYEPELSGTTLTLNAFPGEYYDEPTSGYTVVTQLDRLCGMAGVYSATDAGEIYYTVAPQTIDNYESTDDVRNDVNSLDDVPAQDNDTFYMLWFKPLDSIAMTIDPPVCGVEVSTSGMDQTNPPSAAVTSGHAQVYPMGDGRDFAFWMEDIQSMTFFNGTFEGGQTYQAAVMLAPEFGYAIDTENPPAFTLNGKTDGFTARFDPGNIQLEAELEAEHDPGPETEENRKEPTCTKDGSYDLVVRCDACDAVISSETKTIPAPGHTPGETVEENHKEPTCTEDGSYDEVVYCETCDAELSRKTITIPKTGHKWAFSDFEIKTDSAETKITEAYAVYYCENDADHEQKVKAQFSADETKHVDATCEEYGEDVYTVRISAADSPDGKEHVEDGLEFVLDPLGHDWGEWKVTKEPAVDVYGEETRTCSRCGETETRDIDPLDPAKITYRNTKGDDQTWTKGSTKPASFTFKRSADDETTFDHFNGILIDGRIVATTNYTAKKGSVIVSVKPAYLEKLKTGKHTISAMFDDGNNADADFTILAQKKDSSSGSSSSNKSSSSTAKKSGSTSGKSASRGANTGDDSQPLLWGGLLGASLLIVLYLIYRKRRQK